MAYSELIKDFSRIREYMRQFFVYGFKTRAEYDSKSARSYDNEKRRMESWLGKYMSFRKEESGKVSFISVDTREIKQNPLYSAFKAKSFTSNDIILFFYVLDILSDGGEYSAADISNTVMDDYLAEFDEYKVIDESTVRKKLKEYEVLGLIESGKEGRRLLYRFVEDNINLNSWKNALAFYSEADPLGVIGSYTLDKLDAENTMFSFKHHYILHALESEIMYELLDAIHSECDTVIKTFSKRHQKIMQYTIIPLKVYISTKNGRSYVLAYEKLTKRYNMYRLDNIKAVHRGVHETNYKKFKNDSVRFTEYMWNASSGRESIKHHVTVIFKISNADIIGRAHV